VRHFADSLSCLIALGPLLERRPAARVVDVGTGAGFPGLPLKLARPELELTLVDSVGKKTAFLEQVLREMGLEDVAVLTIRAEELGQRPEHREHYDAVVSRALAGLPALLELCLPLLRIGGRLVAPRRGPFEPQLAEAAYALRELGGAAQPTVPVDLGPSREGFGLVVIDKVSATPARYPRRSGLPARRPLLGS
jgi:16S rRNA (guanine527-N7)-methyltransferase